MAHGMVALVLELEAEQNEYSLRQGDVCAVQCMQYEHGTKHVSDVTSAE